MLPGGKAGPVFEPDGASVFLPFCHTAESKATLIRAGVIKKGDKRQFGLNNLRHSLATSLISWGLDFKTVQTQLRHANPTATLAVYAQGIDANRLAAQGAMMDAVLHPVSAVVQ